MRLDEAKSILDEAGYLIEMEDDYYYTGVDELEKLKAQEKAHKNWLKTLNDKQSEAKQLAPLIKKILNDKGWRAKFYEKEWIGGPCFYVRGNLTPSCKFYAKLEFILGQIPSLGFDSKITIDEEGVFKRSRKINANSNLGNTCPKDIQKGYNNFLKDLQDILNYIGK